MKTALLTSLLTLAGSAPAFAALNCEISTRAFAADLMVQTIGDGAIAGTYTNGRTQVVFEGTQTGTKNGTVTYALKGGTLTSLAVTETFVPDPTPARCPRCAGTSIVKTTVELLGAGAFPRRFSKCTGSL